MRKSTLFLIAVFVPLLSLYFRYITIPSYPFPAPPPDALQSTEPADVESPLRRAYFTQYTRDQVIAHYAAQVKYLPFMRLNYPPEEAQTIIRDQTRSWYLEELTHPLRDSLYINGFIPQKAQDNIVINGKSYAEKITIKYVPTSLPMRLVASFAILAVIYFLFIEWKKALSSLLSS
jgi:hypothetical protein